MKKLKKITVAILLSIMTISVSGCSGNNQDTTTNKYNPINGEYTFTNQEAGFKIVYGDNWQVSQIQNCDAFMVLADDNGNVREEIRVQKENLPEGSSNIDDIQDVYSQQMGSGILTVSKIIVDGIDGYWLTLDPMNDTQAQEFANKEKNDIAYTIKDNYVYVFRITSTNPIIYEEDLSKIDTALGGFSFE